MHVVYLLALLFSGPADKPCQGEEDQAWRVCHVMAAKSVDCMAVKAKLLQCREDQKLLQCREYHQND